MIIGHLSFTISSSFAFPASQKLGAHTVVMLPLGEPDKPPQRSDFNPRPKSHFSHSISLGVLGQPIPHRNSYVVTNAREHRHSRCLPIIFVCSLIIFPLFPLPFAGRLVGRRSAVLFQPIPHRNSYVVNIAQEHRLSRSLIPCSVVGRSDSSSQN